MRVSWHTIIGNIALSAFKVFAGIFAHCADIGEAHKLSALVFGVEKPLHLKGNFVRKTDSVNSGVYDEEPFALSVKNRTRSYQEVFRKNRIILPVAHLLIVFYRG